METWHEQARFEGVDTRREALRILAAKAASLKPGDWIMVQGAGRLASSPMRPAASRWKKLDGAAPKNPLFVQEGYATVYANSLALKAVGLNPADGATSPGARARVVPAALCVVRRHAARLAGAARPESHRLHARAQLDRASPVSTASVSRTI